MALDEIERIVIWHTRRRARVRARRVRLRRPPLRPGRSHASADVAVEIRTKDSGDQKGKGRGAIEEAAAQVLRGTAGLANFLKQNPRVSEDTPKLLVPVVFTTARLLCSAVDLSTAELTTGRLASVEVTERPWISYQHNLSSSLQPALPMDFGQATLSSIAQMLRLRHARSIAIVSVSGIESFLTEIVSRFHEFVVP